MDGAGRENIKSQLSSHPMSPSQPNTVLNIPNELRFSHWPAAAGYLLVRYSVTDMVKAAELNLYRRLRKAESELIETTINEVENCLRNRKSFSNTVQCNVTMD